MIDLQRTRARAPRRRGDTDYLKLVPRRAVEHEDVDDERIVLLRPKWTRGLLARWLQPRMEDKYFRIRLDDVGTATWLLIDGNRDVGDICEALFRRFGDRVEPRFERGARFISQLESSDMVVLESPADPAEE